MGLTYFKRYRMELNLVGRDLAPPPVSDEYRFLRWEPSLLEAHAETKYLSFRDEIDANIFPCFNELPGCRRLMRDISRRTGFLPGATWLAVCGEEPFWDLCGTVQGLCNQHGLGSIQNLGITPNYRDQGLGTHLLYRALRGFRQAGLNRVWLEVTADNASAVRLYEKHGFRLIKTIFKAAEVAYS